MTNKMPVVGKRYRNKKHNTIIIVKSINDGWITTKGFCKIHISDFWNWFKDEQNMSKPEPKIDMKEECGEAKDIDVPTKSIWKLTKEEIYRCNFSSYQIWLYEIFINSFEQIQKDIEELKRNKLEGK